MLYNTLGDKPVVKWFSALSIWKETTGLVLVSVGFTGLTLALLGVEAEICCEINLSVCLGKVNVVFMFSRGH